MPLTEGQLIGKYRRLLIPFEELKAEALELNSSLESLRTAHNQSRINDAQLAAYFVILFAERRTQRSTGLLSWLDSNEPPESALLMNSLQHLQIPGMPGMIFSLLTNWLAAKVDLRLTREPVSAKAMLHAQAEGWRYVTLSFENARSGKTLEASRDAFEFALHDLGHAYAFFKADYDPQGQVSFFRELSNDLETLTPLALADEKFADDLEYCMADMNSHPQHLRQYLRGVLVEMFLRREKCAEEYETELQGLLASLQCMTSFKPTGKLFLTSAS